MKTGTVDDVLVHVEAILGGADLSVRELSSLAKGRIVELDSICGEPVELRAGGRLVARGEVVVIDEKFGLRITRLEEGGAI